MNALGGRNSAANVPGLSGRVTGRPLSPGLPEPEWQRDDNPGQPVTCGLSKLRPHPSYVRLRLAVPPSKLSALAEQGERAFREPLVITREHIVIDGYARWELARLRGRLTVPCVEYELTEEEVLRWLLQKHRRSNGMNDFCRILLALELEPCFKARAVANQRTGGQMKGLSNLTEAITVDVRKEIAVAAGVSVGNVTKVKQLMGNVRSELSAALRSGEISIHRAWKWRTESAERQIVALMTYRNKSGINKTIRDLIWRHKSSNLPAAAPDLRSLIRRLSGLKADESSAINVAVIRATGNTIFVTEELIQSLPPYQESIPTCRRDNR